MPSKPERWSALRSAPAPSSEAARIVMRANRGKNTEPELALRRELHRRGLRYRIHQRPAPAIRATADLLFRTTRVAVFVDGCFWHGCPTHHTKPKSNADYWRAKVGRNRERDRNTTEALRAAGWTVIRVWEHETARDAADRVEAAVRAA